MKCNCCENQKNSCESHQCPTYVTKIDKLTELSPLDCAQLAEVTQKYAFRANDYYRYICIIRTQS